MDIENQCAASNLPLKKTGNAGLFSSFIQEAYLPALEDPERVLDRARGAGRDLR